MLSRRPADQVRAARAFAVGGLVIALLAIEGGTSAFGDSLEVYDELILAALVKDKCHLKIDGEDTLDRKTMDGKLRSIGKAAFDLVRKNLDNEDPSQREENGRQADFMLKKRTEKLVVSTYPKLIDEVGCAALEQRARDAFAHLIQ